MVNKSNLNSRELTIIVAMLTMIGPLSIDTYLPSFPAIESDYQISRALLSQSLGLYLAAFALSTLVVGPLTDKFGRRKIIIFSLVFYLAASLGCAMSPNYHAFLLFRVLQGSAAAGGLVAGRAMIRDVNSPQEAHRAMSKVMMLFAVAPAIAPIIGGLLHDWFGWRSVFYFLASYSALVMVLLIFRVSETLALDMRQSIHPANIAKVYGNTLKHSRYIRLVLITASIFSGMFVYVAGAPSFIYEFFNLGSGDFYLLFVPLVCGLIFGSWLSGMLSYRWRMEQTVKLALLSLFIGTVLNVTQAYYLKPMLLVSIVPLIFYTCGVGIAMPALTVLAMDCFPNNRGSATAMQGFTQMMGNAMNVSIVVPLLIAQPLTMALGQFAFIMCAFLLWWRLPLVIK